MALSSQRAWDSLYQRHAGDAVQFDIGAAERFRGRVRSGCIGPLRYVRTWTSHGRMTQAALPAGRSSLPLWLVASGTARCSVGPMAVTARAGDFVWIDERQPWQIEIDRPTELITLHDLLPAADVLRSFGERSLVHRPARGEGAAMLARWLRDVCVDRGWQSEGLVASISQVLRSLALEVVHERRPSAAQRLDREAIEQQILCSLEDETLSVNDLADRLGCSVRTLHRVFRREGSESLERYIQRQRVEACAVLLRDPVRAASLSLTELAMRFGFASSSHFSTVFRSYFGMPPSAYREARGAM